MNFRPELAEKVMAGEKTVTRRVASENPRSPWYVGGCSQLDRPDVDVGGHSMTASGTSRSEGSGCKAVRKPCPSCPWRIDQDAQSIPNFSLDLAERLERTTHGDFGATIFACHQSREGEEIPCAGWLAIYGYDSIAIRMMVIAGRVPVEALWPGKDWPELEPDFDAVIEKLRATA